MRKVLFVMLCAFCAAACTKKEHYKLKNKTKEYLAFAGRNSWWLYKEDSTSEVIYWTSTKASNIEFDFDEFTREEFEFACSDSTHKNGISYVCKARSDNDITSASFGYVYSDNNSISSEVAYSLIDTVRIGGNVYTDVFYIEPFGLWIAPNVGIVKMKRGGKLYFLKSYKIEKL